MKVKNAIIRNTLFILFAGILTVSCEKDKDKEEDKLIGTWTAGTSSFNAKVGESTMTDYFTNVMGLTPSDAQLYTNLFNLTMQQSFTGTIRFNSDNSYTSNLGGQTETGTWSMSSDGKQLTLNPAMGSPTVIEVINLTDNEMRVRWTETGSEDINDDTVPETITVEVNVTFTK